MIETSTTEFWREFGSTSISLFDDLLPLVWLIIALFISFWIFYGVGKALKHFFTK